VFAAAALAIAVASPSPQEIFKQAQAAWQQRVVPAYLSFTIPCDETDLADECTAGDVAQFVVRTRDGRSFAQSIGRNAMPGRVLMLGGYTFGAGGAPLGFIRRVGTGPTPPNLAPDPLSIRVIATVSASGPTYAVTLVGTETLEGHRTYHLQLRALFDPKIFPLRELWIDEATFDIVGLTYDWTFSGGHAGSVHYLFAQVGPQKIWAIVHIDAQISRNELFRTRVDQASGDLRDLSFPADWPAVDFIPAAPAG
jgi:hypothetical protein